MSTSTILSVDISPGLGRWSTTGQVGSGGPPPTRVGLSAMPSLPARDCAAPKGKPMSTGASAGWIDDGGGGSIAEVDGFRTDASAGGGGVDSPCCAVGPQPIARSATEVSRTTRPFTIPSAALAESRGESDR